MCMCCRPLIIYSLKKINKYSSLIQIFIYIILILKDSLQKQILVNYFKLEIKRSSAKVISSQVVC
jgi:hypothetical protein